MSDEDALPLLDGRYQLRFFTVDDAEASARAFLANRAHLQPWEPTRSEDFYTPAGQREILARGVSERESGRSFGWLILDGVEVVGRINLNDVVHGAFENGNIGYWIAQDHQGLGLGSAALKFVCDFAAHDLGLHRLQAGTLVHNLGSQRVLAKNGFSKFGMAPEYLRINGQWQDHNLYQKILTP